MQHRDDATISDHQELQSKSWLPHGAKQDRTHPQSRASCPPPPWWASSWPGALSSPACVTAWTLPSPPTARHLTAHVTAERVSEREEEGKGEMTQQNGTVTVSLKRSHADHDAADWTYKDEMVEQLLMGVLLRMEESTLVRWDMGGGAADKAPQHLA